MKILLLASAYNGLTQRIHVELLERRHTVSVELALNDEVIREGVQIFHPEIILCPFLKQKIPESVWRAYLCIIIHPGIQGDRGPSSLDWAIQNGVTEWGVTALQAAEEMDAGDIWATETFPMRPGTKSSLYTLEVTEAAVKAMLKTLERFQQKDFKPKPLDYGQPGVKGRLLPAMKQADRALDWDRDTTGTVLAKINAADGSPGVRDIIGGTAYYLYGARKEDNPDIFGKTFRPGELIARRFGAVCRATRDGAVWLSHLKSIPVNGNTPSLKLPAVVVLKNLAQALPEWPLSLDIIQGDTYRDIGYEEQNAVGYLNFDFYNGAMATEQCQRLQVALLEALKRPTKVLVLAGGRSSWSNGIHLNVIEAATHPAEESWRNIQAIDNLIHTILNATGKITIAAVHGNAGAGGVPFALACDKVFARAGVIFNPHYRSMGLYGSEYWTYTLPKRIGYAKAQAVTQSCLPMGMREAQRLGMVDTVIPDMFSRFDEAVVNLAEAIAHSAHYAQQLSHKRAVRSSDEFVKPLDVYRQEELAIIKTEFYESSSPYHSARKNFVYKIPATGTPARLSLHRRSYSTATQSEREKELEKEDNLPVSVIETLAFGMKPLFR